MKSDLVICSCGSVEHQLVFMHDQEDRQVYCYVHLASLPFWERVAYGIKYIFGYQSRFGAFDEVIINGDSTEAFQKIVGTLSAEKEFYQTNLKNNNQ